MTNGPAHSARRPWADFIGGLGPVSAASQLIRASLQVELGRASGVRIPTVLNSAAAAKFVAEGRAIPVADLALSGPILKPNKLAAVLVYTAETAKSTAFEAIARQTLSESFGLSLDAAMLGTAPETDESAAGLRNGAATVMATAGGGADAMTSDMAKLAQAVVGVAGMQIAFVAEGWPRRADFGLHRGFRARRAAGAACAHSNVRG